MAHQALGFWGDLGMGKPAGVWRARILGFHSPIEECVKKRTKAPLTHALQTPAPAENGFNRFRHTPRTRETAAMAEKTSPSSWMTRLRKRPAPARTDWGDLGTAIGMEMALVPQNLAPEPSGAKGLRGATAPAPRWWSRRR
jgi:hypothetical protein